MFRDGRNAAGKVCWVHQISNDGAMLRGTRCVTAIEAEQGRRMAESLIKQLTRNDSLTAWLRRLNVGSEMRSADLSFCQGIHPIEIRCTVLFVRLWGYLLYQECRGAHRMPGWGRETVLSLCYLSIIIKGYDKAPDGNRTHISSLEGWGNSHYTTGA